MLGNVLSVYMAELLECSQQPYGVISLIVPTTQMRTMRLRHMRIHQGTARPGLHFRGSDYTC